MNDTGNNSSSLRLAFSLLLAVCLFFVAMNRVTYGNHALDQFTYGSNLAEIRAEMHGLPVFFTEIPVKDFAWNDPADSKHILASCPGFQQSIVTRQILLRVWIQQNMYAVVKPVISRALKHACRIRSISDDYPLSC